MFNAFVTMCQCMPLLFYVFYFMYCSKGCTYQNCDVMYYSALKVSSSEKRRYYLLQIAENASTLMHLLYLLDEITFFSTRSGKTTLLTMGVVKSKVIAKHFNGAKCTISSSTQLYYIEVLNFQWHVWKLDRHQLLQNQNYLGASRQI